MAADIVEEEAEYWYRFCWNRRDAVHNPSFVIKIRIPAGYSESSSEVKGSMMYYATNW